jgi:type I restriction enzyme M protein
MKGATATLLARVSEGRAEEAARELLAIRGWDLARPPKGNVLWKNEYKDYPILAESLVATSKHGKGDGYPDFIVYDPRRHVPLMIGETKNDAGKINVASAEASSYANGFAKRGIDVLAVGVAGSAEHKVAVRVQKIENGTWRDVEYRNDPIEWLPTPDETQRLLLNPDLFTLTPDVPPPEVLEAKADEINRILRECSVNDQRRPAAVAAFMLALWKTQGRIRTDPEYVLTDINAAARRAFRDAGKIELDESIAVDEANESLQVEAHRIVRIFRLLNVTTVTGAHDYLGQLYEHFFRYTGQNTIGQFFTPRHVTRFMADLTEVSERDFVVDPSCGTGGFLIASLYRMMAKRSLTPSQIKALVQDKLWGFEREPITAGLCVANMILRGDGTTGVVKGDCFTDPRYPLNKADIVLGNPPFPHAGSDEQPEKFVDRALDALRKRGEAAMVVPASMLVKGGVKQKWRRDVLRENTLKAVIKLPDELFQPYATTYTNIAILIKGVPHKPNEPVFFARIENDGYRLKKNVRVPKPGEQFTQTHEALRNRTELAGWRNWRPLAEDDDWSPGAYIESTLASQEDVRREVDDMLRSDAALHARFADQMSAFYRRLKANTLSGTRYPSMTKRPSFTLTDEPGMLGNYFSIYYGQRNLHSKEWLEPGDAMVVSSSGEYNGCYGFFDYENLIKPPFATVPSTGTIGMSFVQRLPCGVTDDCLILIPKEGVPDEALYVASAVVRLERWRFSYGRKITPSRIARFKFAINPETIEWIARRRKEVERLSSQVVNVMADEQGIVDDFRRLVERWELERPRGAELMVMAEHPIFQSIVGMGQRAISLLLGELDAKTSAAWMVALNTITGINPVPREDEGNIKRMAAAWIRWGNQRGYIGVLD